MKYKHTTTKNGTKSNRTSFLRENRSEHHNTEQKKNDKALKS